MNTLDIFSPMISVVSKSIEGKTIVIYGGNSTGKTKQATRAKNPYYLAFERGINAIAGIPFPPILTWSDFIKVRKQLTGVGTLEKAKSLYSTIVCDTVSAMAMMCQEYVCNKYGADSISSGKEGYGLYDEYKQAFWKEINALTNCGYTVIFIAHDSEKEFVGSDGIKYKKIVPEGDKRSISPIVDLCDIVTYLEVNGLDENGREKLSSAYFVNTKQFLARSRFDYMVPYIETFTIENLEKAISDGVEAEEKATGIKSVTYEEQNETYEHAKDSFEDLSEKIKSYALRLNDLGRMSEYTEIVENVLGNGKKVSEANKKQIQQLEVILSELEELNFD